MRPETSARITTDWLETIRPTARISTGTSRSATRTARTAAARACLSTAP